MRAVGIDTQTFEVKQKDSLLSSLLLMTTYVAKRRTSKHTYVVTNLNYVVFKSVNVHL